MTNNALKTYTLRRGERLKSSSRITSVLKNGKRLHGRYISLYFAPAEHTAFAVLIKKKVGNAVQRNKVKRWIRETYRREKHKILFSCTLIVLIETEFVQLNFALLQSEMVQLLAKLSKEKL